MSRPPWLYGTPTTTQHDNSCFLEHPPNSIPDPQVLWEWQHYSQNHTSTTATSSTSSTTATATETTTTKTKQKTKHRLLIAQYTGWGTYSQMLDWIAPVNKAYAKQWGADFVSLQGTAMRFPHILDPTTPTTTTTNNNGNGNNNHNIHIHCDDAPRATFDKIPLLELAQQHSPQNYDYVLVLDTDAMIVNHQTDLTLLLPESHLLAAHRVWKYADYWRNTWDINAGIMLWNIQHPTFDKVLQEWKHMVQMHPQLVLERNDDQYFLQHTLLNMGFWNRYTYALHHGEFEYYDATHIKHFKRDERSWATSLEERIHKIQQSIERDVCHNNPSSPTTTWTTAMISDDNHNKEQDESLSSSSEQQQQQQHCAAISLEPRVEYSKKQRPNPPQQQEEDMVRSLQQPPEAGSAQEEIQ